jgi:N-methylhydantoinase A
VKSGHLPEEFVLYAFGGAGPVHAVGYARDLRIRSIHVFPSSAVFSAFGIAMADLVHTRVATRYLPLPVEPEALNRDLEEMEEVLAGLLRDDGFSGAPEFRRYLTMRFRRQTQGEDVALPWSRFDAGRVAELERLFVSRYAELYGGGVAYGEAGIDIGAVRVDAIGKVQRPVLPAHEPAGEDATVARKGTRRAYLDGDWVETAIYDQAHLATGMRVVGPAIVESPFTTVVLPPGSRAAVDAFESLVIVP